MDPSAPSIAVTDIATMNTAETQAALRQLEAVNPNYWDLSPSDQSLHDRLTVV